MLCGFVARAVDAHACCIDQGGFLEVASKGTRVVLATVVRQTSRSIDIEVTPRDSARVGERAVWRIHGGGGSGSFAHASHFPLGSTWMFVLARDDDDLTLDGCGQYQVPVRGERALGVDLRTANRVPSKELERRDLSIAEVYAEVDRATMLRAYADRTAQALLETYESFSGPTTLRNRFEAATIVLRVDRRGALRDFELQSTRDIGEAQIERMLREVTLPAPPPELRDELEQRGVVVTIERLRLSS